MALNIDFSGEQVAPEETPKIRSSQSYSCIATKSMVGTGSGL